MKRFLSALALIGAVAAAPAAFAGERTVTFAVDNVDLRLVPLHRENLDGGGP